MKRNVLVIVLMALAAIAYCKPVRNALGAKAGEKGIRLPYDAEVQYLESTGTQWINTGIAPNVIDSKIEITYASGSGHLFGARTHSDPTQRYLWSLYAPGMTTIRGDWIGSKAYISVAASAKKVTFVSHANGSAILYNDTTYAGDSKTTISDSIYLFAVNTSGSVSVAITMQLYDFKIWQSNLLVRDMIPVRFTNESGQSEGAMYDRVSGQLFRNQGTGAFLYGPDKN